MYYILIGKNPVMVQRDDLLLWGQWFEANAKLGTRHIGRLEIPARKPFKKGGKMLNRVNRKRAESVFISTVFLGFDHNHFGGEPILFESMVFGGAFDQYQRRYFTFDEARQAHKALVKRVTQTIAFAQSE